MLSLRAAIKAALGSSFNVTHAGPAGSVTVTVPVVDAGIGDETALPCVAIMSEFGASKPSNIGGHAAENESYCDLDIAALDADTINGGVILADIHSKIETLLRAVEASLGSSYFSNVSAYRDLRPQDVRGYHVYRRTVTVRGINFESY